MTRVCLLTGASGEFGRAFLDRFGDELTIAAVHRHRPVWAASQNQIWIDPIEPTAELIENGRPILTIHADLRKPSECARVIEEVATAHGGIDLIVNAAAHRHWAEFMAPEALADGEETLSVNVLAPLRLSVAAAQRLWMTDIEGNESRNRHIINVSSSAATYVYPDLGQGMYASSKAALNQATYHLASEFWNLGVRVNAVAPDTFPARVPTERVLDAIAELDSGSETGVIREIVPP